MCWGGLRSLREGEGTAVYFPQSWPFSALRRRLEDKCDVDWDFYAYYWAQALLTAIKMTMLFSENIILLVTCTQRTTAPSLIFSSELTAQRISSPLSPQDLLLTTAGDQFVPLNKQATFLILVQITRSIMNYLNYTALFTYRFMNMKYSD